jgi:DNA-directed RNA polymerase specialized sigma24 family protein
MEPADAVLAALVRRARDDELAARIVLQRLVPGLVTIAARRARRSPGGGREAQALFDDLAANAWLLIRSYPIERRPRKIAVNLLRDTEYQTCVRWHRLRAATEVAVGHPNDEEAAPVTDLMGRRVDQRPSADEVAAVLAAGAAAGVEGADLRLLSSLYLDDRPLAEVAKSMRCTVRTVRNLRALATARLRSAVLAPAA